MPLDKQLLALLINRTMLVSQEKSWNEVDPLVLKLLVHKLLNTKEFVDMWTITNELTTIVQKQMLKLADLSNLTSAQRK